MNNHRIAFLVATVFFYCIYVYAVRGWLALSENGNNIDDINKETEIKTNEVEIMMQDEPPVIEEIIIKRVKAKVHTKVIPWFIRNACSVLEVFTTKPIRYKPRLTKMESDSNTVAVFGCILFLLILIFSAILDVIKAKEEERVRLTQNPEGERRQSLSEFANKKCLRRESSKFGLQLFQIAETPNKEEEERDQEKQSRRQTRTFTRGESTNSYLSDRATEGENSPRSTGSPTREMKLVKRQSVARIFGTRPAPMVRRSSSPALPLNPDIQALMLGSRRPSSDSDDEEGKGRRVRIIRRY